METNPLNYQFGEFTLDVERGCLFRAGNEVKLRPKVYEALCYFLENSGRLIGKQELIQAVWPDTFVTDDSLVQCTVELRRALDDRSQQFLKTVPRRGYLFNAQVVRSAAKPELAAHPSAVETEACKLPETQLPPKKLNLPMPRTSLIGRAREINEAVELLLRPGVRLLTLTGAGGSGKTRLAIAVAAGVAEHFPAGVQFVGLASITRPDLVATALAKPLKIQQVPNRTLPELIAEQLEESGPLLLLLDNFEQVLPAAKLISEILAASPSLKIIVTSRSCLHVYGEQEFPVAPLTQNSARELFVQRATAVRPNFAITPENAGAIEGICSRLDGLPLAIELAAARTKVLSPKAILDRLHSRLELLTGGALDLPERQQALRKTIDWSYDLLSEPEQKLLRRFSVFAGGGTLEAAEAVCNTAQDLGIDPFEGLSSLVDKNLVQHVDRDDSEARFTMLETIREYALERLLATDEEPSVRRAHAAYCLVIAEEGNPELESDLRSVWLTQCDSELDNFRSALDWLFENRELEWALRLCTALFRFWDMREHLTEGRARMEAVLLLASDGFAKERAKLSLFLGALATAQGDFPSAQTYLDQSLSLYQELGDRWGVGASLNALAVSARDRGDYLSAQENFERSLESWRALSDRIATARCLHNLANVAKVRGNFGRAQAALQEATTIFESAGDRSGAAWSINQQGDIARDEGQFDAARDFYRHALSVFQEIGDSWGKARSLADLGHIYCEQHDYAAAHTAYGEALQIFADLGLRRGIARVLEGLACLAVAQVDADRALTLAAAAAHLRHLVGAPLPPAEQSRLDRTLLPAWESLRPDEAKQAWARGAALNIERAIQYSMEKPSPPISTSSGR